MHDLECSTLVKGLEFSYSFQKGKLGCSALNSAKDMVSLFAINGKYNAGNFRIFPYSD